MDTLKKDIRVIDIKARASRQQILIYNVGSQCFDLSW